LKRLRKQDRAFAIFLIAVIIFLFIAPFILLPQIYGLQNIWNKDLPENTVFLELWEIDTFEGGSASRVRFLEKTAYKFQELNNTVYIFVRNLTLEQARVMLENGEKPDMVSFGIGAGEMLQSYCQGLDIKTPVRSDIIVGGEVNSQQLAMPWCMGGYMLATLGEFDLESDLSTLQKSSKNTSLIGTGGVYNLSRQALSNNNLDYFPDALTQYQAYEKFLVGSNFDILLGTQRDYFRLQNKVNLGVLSNCNFKYIGGFSDLVQYIAITAENEDIINCANNFIRYLCSVTIQKTLKNIGMFSVTSIKIYDDNYSDFENTMMQKIVVQNVFVNNVELDKLRKGE